MNLAETWHALQCPAIPKANAEMCEFRGQHEFGSFEVQPKMLLGFLRNLHFTPIFPYVFNTPGSNSTYKVVPPSYKLVYKPH